MNSSSGAFTRNSISTNAASNTKAPTSESTTSSEPQPSDWPWLSSNTSATMASAKTTVPA